MKRETKEIIKLTTREILEVLTSHLEETFSVFDTKQPIFWQNRPVGKDFDWQDLRRKIARLKHQGMIRRITEGKDSYLEITDLGKEHLRNISFRTLKVPRPHNWDRKWRIVIYDIPEDDKMVRDIIRQKLYQIGFEQVQKSVFVYPFDCTQAVNLICQRYGERDCIKYMVAEIIEGEESIMETFLSKGILAPGDLA